MSDGLEGVIAARTVLSDVDGAKGRLVIRGYAVEDLSGRTRYEEAAHLLFDGFFEDAPSDLAPALGEAGVRAFAEVAASDEGWPAAIRSRPCAPCWPACPTATTCRPPCC
jgi:citrate synthase